MKVLLVLIITLALAVPAQAAHRRHHRAPVRTDQNHWVQNYWTTVLPIQNLCSVKRYTVVVLPPQTLCTVR